MLSPFGESHQMEVVSQIISTANEEEKIEILQHPLIGITHENSVCAY